MAELSLLLLLAILLAGCTSNTSPASADQHTAPAQAGTSTAEPSAISAASPDPTGPALTVAGSSSAELTGPSCATAGARAIAAAAALLPDETSRNTQDIGFCSDGQPLDVTYPSTSKLTWTVTVKVTAGTATDCQAGAAGASARCVPISGHPGVIGAEAVCSAIACDQAWVSGGGYLAVVGGFVPGGQVGVSQPAIPDFSGLGTAIGVSVLAALHG